MFFLKRSPATSVHNTRNKIDFIMEATYLLPIQDKNRYS